MKSLIKKLVETPGPSGYEAQIRAVIRSEVAPLADEIVVDNLGNLIARMGNKSGKGMRIMIAAHMDEIGMIASHVDENGFVRFSPIGAITPRSCWGGRVRFLNGSIGTISGERLEDLTRLHSIDQLFIDLGATSRLDCPVKVGDIAVFDRPFTDLGKRLLSKAMDDRIGVAVLIETMRILHEKKAASPHQLFFVFTTQEEVGLRGATVAAFGVEPDLGLAVDVTATGDTPKAAKMDVGLGKGPAIKVRDQKMLADPRVIDWMVESAGKEKIPCQLEILPRGWTDALAIQISRLGVPAGCLSIPSRYVHSSSEMVDYTDVQNAVRLLSVLLSNPFQLPGI